MGVLRVIDCSDKSYILEVQKHNIIYDTKGLSEEAEDMGANFQNVDRLLTQPNGDPQQKNQCKSWVRL